MAFLPHLASWRDRFANFLRDATRRSLAFAGLIERPDFRVERVPDHPELSSLQPHVLYVVGDRSFQKWALLKCPCGCGEPIMLSLSQKRRPKWAVVTDWLDRPSVAPSIWQTAGCYSHFWIKQGRIRWTKDTGRPHSHRVGNEG